MGRVNESMSDLPVAAPDHADEIRGALGWIRAPHGSVRDRDKRAALAALDTLLAEQKQDKERIEEMGFALAFYADPVNYENESPFHVRPVITDQGAIARAALAVEEDAE